MSNDTQREMISMTVCPGLDEAVIGTYVNEHKIEVPVYDIHKVIQMFSEQGKSTDFAVDWMEGVYSSWDEHIRPVFVNYDPRLGSRIKGMKGLPN